MKKTLEDLVPIIPEIQKLALLMTVNCVRNTVIETYHADGKITDPEMKAFNKEVANRIYTVLVALLDSDYRDDIDDLLKWLQWNYPDKWDLPTFDMGLGASMLRSYAERHGISVPPSPWDIKKAAIETDQAA